MTADPTEDRVYESTCGAFAELVAHGVRHAVLSPGSRSTPLTIAARWTEGLYTTIHLDERAAAFFALGLAKETGRPVVLVCTSGTAAANYLPAVIEAHYTGVPLLVFTADRPTELRDWGAGQTIDQVGLYGNHVRWATELPVAGEVEPTWFRRMMGRAVAEATSTTPGPVHLNWPFREPLEPRSGRPSVDREATLRIPATTTGASVGELAVMSEVVGYERGVIVCGPATQSPAGVEAIAAFSRLTGWPVVAEPSSRLRFGTHVESTPIISTADHLLKVTSWAAEHAPEVVVRIGDSPTCKPIRLWLEKYSPKHHVLLDPAGRWNEASFTATDVLRGDVASLLTQTTKAMGDRDETGRPDCEKVAARCQAPRSNSTGWTESWIKADHQATAAVDAVLDNGAFLEAALTRTVLQHLEPEVALYVSNSMAVRDIDAFAKAAPRGPQVFSNRGASGIDGLISCATGVAAGGRPTVLLIGDIALVHDVGGLLFAARSSLPLTLVVANNDGGGIFSFLPIADHTDVSFDELFQTPHGTNLAEFGAVTGIRHHAVTTATDLRTTLTSCVESPGVDIVEVRTDVEANVAQHREVTAAVDAALLS